MNLTQKTVKGVSWAGVSQVIRLLLQFGIIAFLARLLSPKEFGLIAMVVVFTNLAMVFRDFGLTAALVQRKELTEEHLFFSFWLNILAGLILSLIIAAAAPAIAHFYSEPELTPVTIVIGATFFISSFGIVQMALLMKQLDFKRLAIVEISAVAISGTVAILLALAGFGVWSLVWQQVIFSFATVVFLWLFSRWRPQFSFRWQRGKELLGFGLNLTGFNILNYFTRNMGKLLIGRSLGSIPLGFYDLAYRLLLFPLDNISSVIGRVMFPALSIIQQDKAKTRYAYLRATRYIAMVSFPLMLGLLILAPQFVPVIFGPQWGRSIFLIQILALVGLMQSISTTVGWIYQSQGRTDILLRWGIFSTVIVVPSLIIGLRWDVEGVAVAHAIAAALLAYPCFAIPFKLINLKVGHLFKRLSRVILATLAMGAIIFGLRLFLLNTLGANDLITLIACVVIGVISYAGLLFVIDRGLYQEVWQLLGQLRASPDEVLWQPEYDPGSNNEDEL